jgi:hypothetical protein
MFELDRMEPGFPKTSRSGAQFRGCSAHRGPLNSVRPFTQIQYVRMGYDAVEIGMHFQPSAFLGIHNAKPRIRPSFSVSRLSCHVLAYYYKLFYIS